MATNIPPHNLREIVDALTLVIDNSEAGELELLMAVSGPDFPTGGIIYGRKGIRDAYLTGRGKLVVRARESHINI
jgi:DNA gyrase subunit A